VFLRFPKPNLPRAVYWLAALAFTLRILARLYYGGVAGLWVSGYSFFFDVAQSIAAGKGISQAGFPVGYRVPLYPILLAGLTLGHKAFWPIVIAQSAIGAGIVICAASLARQMYRGPSATRAAVLAAAITVEMEPGRSLFDLGGIQSDLETSLGCRVDVGTEKGLKARIRARVLREAIPV